MENDYLEIYSLYHHGIKGQRWGVRRFQNEDGTLTDEGKQRYSQQVNKIKELGDVYGQLESMTRELNLRDASKEAKDKGQKILVSKDFKQKYDSLIKKAEDLEKKYSKEKINVEIKKMDDGADYVVTSIYDKKLEGIVEYYSLIDEKKSDVKHKEDYTMDFLELKELYHHGIKGQKWGMRRYQNRDGTLTEAGKERYGVKGDSNEMSKEGKKLYEKDIRESHESVMDTLAAARTIANESANLAAPKKGSKLVNEKDYTKMSDEELRKKVNRLQMERQYGDLVGDNKYVMTGREKVRETLQTVGSLITIVGGAVGIVYTVNKLTK